MADRVTYGDVFQRCVDWVLTAEGVFSDDACDSGGRTMYGHSTQSWPETLCRMPPDVRSRMPRDVCDVDRPRSIEAYFWGYWRYSGCDTLPPWAGLLMFDATVNGGDARRWLQHAAGVDPDGQVGPRTKAALARLDTVDRIADAIAEFQAWHLAYLVSLGPKWAAFGADNRRPLGWARRLFTIGLDALRLEGEFGCLAPTKAAAQPLR